MRIKNGLLLLAVLALVLPLAMVSAQDGGAIEPNDSREGVLSNSQATYSLALEAGQAVSVTLNSDEFDPYLQLMDAAGAVVAEDDDSGGGLNSALLFTAPATATYTVVVGAYGGSDATGIYVVSTSVAEIVELTYGSSTKVLFDGVTGVYYYSFMGKEGDVINLFTDNEEVDTRLVIYGPDGSEIAYDDDSGPGYAALIRRVMLPASGAYSVELSPFSEDETGVTNLVLEQTELSMLDSGAQTVTFNDDLSLERFGLTVTEGMSYRVTVTMDAAANGSLEVMLDPEYYDVASVNYNNTSEVSMSFVSSVSGVVPVEIMDYSWAADAVSYTIAVTPLQ